VRPGCPGEHRLDVGRWGGGSGITVICGVAAPVQPPRMGMVRKPKIQHTERGRDGQRISLGA
jgi:hypothetical protein